MILIDVGVWLAAVWGRHQAHPVVRNWFDAQERDLAFCRVTQMSLLRLLTNPTIMGGDVVTRAGAWSIYDRLRGDDRIVVLGEPDALDATWRSLSDRDDARHKLWTDDYLSAFARAGHLSLVTLDQAFARRHGIEATLLS